MGQKYVPRAGAAPRVADYRPKRRKCLGSGCGREFWSQGPGNRKCSACARRERALGAVLSWREEQMQADRRI